jgi:hypothetical protein
VDALWIAVPATAVLSALLTVWLARLAFGRAAARAEADLERRLEEALARAARDIGDAMEKRLRRVIAEALVELRASNMAGSATRAAATTGAELLQEGLRILMGGPARPPAPGSSGSDPGSSA